MLDIGAIKMTVDKSAKSCPIQRQERWKIKNYDLKKYLEKLWKAWKKKDNEKTEKTSRKYCENSIYVP